MSGYDDVKDLQVGDRFIEDCWPEVYIVEEVTQFGVKAREEKTGEITEFGYSDSAYAPVVYKV